MMNGIADRQNIPAALDLLRASSYAYGLSRKYSTAQTCLAALAAIGGVVCTFWMNDYREWSGLFALVVLILDLVVLETQKERCQVEGAKIQEQFDAQVLELPLNQFKVRSEPSPELLQRYATRYGSGEAVMQPLQNWYPAVASQVPIEFGRLICQRSNMQWDSSLRTYVANGYFAVAGTLMVSAVAYGLIAKWEVGDLLLSALLPLFPAFQNLIREGWKHRSSAIISNECQILLEAIWRQCLRRELSKPEAIEVSRRLQDELYDRRRSAPPVPGWIYGFFRNGLEAEMHHAARALVDAVRDQATSGPNVISSVRE